MAPSDLDQFKNLFDESLQKEEEFTDRMINLNKKLEDDLEKLKDYNNTQLDSAISIIKSIITTIKSNVEGHNTKITAVDPRRSLEDAEELFRTKLKNLFEESEKIPVTTSETVPIEAVGGGRKEKKSMVASDSDSDKKNTYGGFESDDGNMYGGNNDEFAFYFSGGEVYSSDESDQSN